MMKAVAEAHDGSVQMFDTSRVRIHQHGGCAKSDETRLTGWPQGGLTTKIHACVGTNRSPARFERTAAALDNHLVTELRHDLKSGDMLLADRGYDADGIREFAGERSAWATFHQNATAKVRSALAPIFAAYAIC